MEKSATADPILPTPKNEPIEPIEHAEPIEAIERIEPFDAIESIEFSEPIDLKGTKIPIAPISRDWKSFPALAMTTFAGDYVRSGWRLNLSARIFRDSAGVFTRAPEQHPLLDGSNFGPVTAAIPSFVRQCLFAPPTGYAATG